MKRFLRLGLFLIITLSLGLLGAFARLSWQQANSFVCPNTYRFVAPETTLLDYEDIEFLSADGLRLRGWYYASTREDGASILFVHGHGGNRLDFENWANILAPQGYGILLFDMRACSENEKTFVTMGVNEAGDVEAALNFFSNQPSVNPERIAIFGHSMGAATAILATARLPQARAVIASSSYTSVRNVLNDRIPTTIGIPALFFPDMIVAMSSYLSGADYAQANPLAVVAEIHQPILFMAGTNDDTIPSKHSEILYNAANEPKEFHYIEGANHNDIFGSHITEVLPIVQHFLENYLVNE